MICFSASRLKDAMHSPWCIIVSHTFLKNFVIPIYYMLRDSSLGRSGNTMSTNVCIRRSLIFSGFVFEQSLFIQSFAPRWPPPLLSPQCDHELDAWLECHAIIRPVIRIEIYANGTKSNNPLPFDGEENNEPDGDEAEGVRREQKALAHARCVHPANTVSSRPQGKTSLQPVE